MFDREIKMTKDRFQVIEGGKVLAASYKYKFKNAFCTSTRWMGVIGARAHWYDELGNEVVQFFHLDFEEFGIDGHEEYIGINKEQIAKIDARIMGGLGGGLVPISRAELVHVLKSCYEVNEKYQEFYGDDLTEVMPLIEEKVELDEEQMAQLYGKISCEIKSDEHLINYYIMRQVALDYKVAGRIEQSEDQCDFFPTEEPSTLIKNTIRKISEGEERVYSAKSLIDYGRKYKHIVSTFTISGDQENRKIRDCRIEDYITISNVEAAFQLKKREFVSIYYIDDIQNFTERLKEVKPGLMVNTHENGDLYTEFYKHNNHVNKDVYYLNGDIYAIYYVTDQGQLVVSSFCEKNLDEIEKMFDADGFSEWLDHEDDLQIDTPVLYDFVNSGYGNFFDFLEKGFDRDE